MSLDGISPLRALGADESEPEALMQGLERALRDRAFKSIMREGAIMDFDAGWRGGTGMPGCHGSLQIAEREGVPCLIYHLSYGRWAVLAGVLVPAIFALGFRFVPAGDPITAFIIALVLMPMAWLALMILPHRWLALASLRRIKAILAHLGDENSA